MSAANVLQLYEDLVSLLCEDGHKISNAIFAVTPLMDCERIAKPLIPLMASKGVAEEFIRTLFEAEVNTTFQESTLFRSMTPPTTCMSVFARHLGKQYLKETVLPMISIVLREPSMEMDPSKLADGGFGVARNKDLLRNVCTQIMNELERSINHLPWPVWRMCHDLYDCVNKKFPSSATTSVGGVYFLRFICPVLLSPENLDPEMTAVTPEQRRNLVLVSKTLQTMSNEQVFGKKEAYMLPMNQWINKNKGRMQEILKKVAEGPKGEEVVMTLPTWDVGDCFEIHKIISTYQEKLMQQITDQDLKERLTGLLQELGEPVMPKEAEIADGVKSFWKKPTLTPEMAAILAAASVGETDAVETTTKKGKKDKEKEKEKEKEKKDEKREEKERKMDKKSSKESSANSLGKTKKKRSNTNLGSSAALRSSSGDVDKDKPLQIPDSPDSLSPRHSDSTEIDSAASVAKLYSELVQLLALPRYPLPHTIFQVMPLMDCERVAKPLIPLLASVDAAEEFIRELFRIEVNATVQESTLFRSMTPPTTCMSVFARHLGKQFLKETVLPVVEMISQIPPIEVDPAKSPVPGDVEKSIANLKDISTKVLSHFAEAVPRTPWPLWRMCRDLHEIIAEKFPNSALTNVGGIYFLRFLSPVILSPENLDPEMGLKITPPIRRNLVLVSKILQTLSNQKNFSNKEAFMVPFNSWLQQHEHKMVAILQMISRGPVGEEIEITLPTWDAGDCYAVHKLIYENRQKIVDKLNAENHQTVVEQLDSLLEELKEPRLPKEAEIADGVKSFWKKPSMTPELAAILAAKAQITEENNGDAPASATPSSPVTESGKLRKRGSSISSNQSPIRSRRNTAKERSFSDLPVVEKKKDSKKRASKRPQIDWNFAQTRLCEFLTAENFSLLDAFIDSLPMDVRVGQAVCSSIIRLLDPQMLARFMKMHILNEVERVQGGRALFSEMTGFTQLLQAFARVHLEQYLRELLHKPVSAIVKKSAFISDGEKLTEKACKSLGVIAQDITGRIKKSLDKIPFSVWTLCHDLYSLSSWKFGDTAQWAVGRLFFEWFVCPAIENPGEWGVLEGDPKDTAMANLKVVSSILKKLSTNDLYGPTDQLLLMNVWLSDKEHSVEPLLNVLAEGRDETQCETSHIAPSVADVCTVAKELQQNATTIGNKNKGSTVKLLATLAELAIPDLSPEEIAAAKFKKK